MSLSDAASSLPQRHVNTIPKGTEPSFQWNGNEGYITSPLLPNEPDPAFWEVLMQDWGLSPDTTEVVDGSVNIRGWDANMGRDADGHPTVHRMKYYRAQIRRRQGGERSINVDTLCEKVLKRKPLKSVSFVNTVDRALVITFSDWQTGKGEGGGPEAMTERICLAQDRVVERVKELRKAGRAPSRIYIAGMGDLVEQCDGYYDMQAFQTVLTRRQQKDLVVYLIDRMVELLVANFPDIQIILTAVPGNHGENRKNGKAFTDWLDNDDLDVFTSTYRCYLKNTERYANVSMPQFDGLVQEDLTITLDICGVPVTFAHGHQFGKGNGGGTVAKIEAWWKGQVMGRTPAADSAILISGHYHHFVASEGTGRQVFQCPAMDGGSKWFTSQTGANSPAGMLTVGIGLDYGSRGWGDLLII